MLRTGQLHRAPPRPRDLARRRGPRYRGPWRLPRPDTHRLAAVSLRSATPSTSLLPRRPSYWTHIPAESAPATRHPWPRRSYHATAATAAHPALGYQGGLPAGLPSVVPPRRLQGRSV